MVIDGGANFFGRVIEVAGEFHFLVTDRGDLGQRAVPVLLQLVANGVELHAQVMNFMVGGSPTQASLEQSGGGCGAGGREKSAAVHEASSRKIDWVARSKWSGEHYTQFLNSRFQRSKVSRRKLRPGSPERPKPRCVNIWPLLTAFYFDDTT